MKGETEGGTPSEVLVYYVIHKYSVRSIVINLQSMLRIGTSGPCT